MLPKASSFEELTKSFRWQIPARYNIGVDISDKWAAIDSGRAAIIHVHPDGRSETFSFGWLSETSNRLANVLRAKGVERGDRVIIYMPQSPEVAASHAAIYKLGAIVLPVAIVFGPEAISYRLQNSGAKAVITNAQGAARVKEVRADAPELKLIISVEGAGDGAEDFGALLSKASSSFAPVDTSPDDPGLMIYTSGTTGQPKGALHGHRVVLGHLPGVEMPHDLFPQRGDLFWTPADWAWAGGLLDVLLPSLHHGIAVVSRKFDKFDPEEAYALMAKHNIRNVFIPPTALRMLRSAKSPRGRHELKLRTLGEWGKEAFGLIINEFYGQTECNLVLGSCHMLGVSKPGAIGKAIPGHEVAVIREDGSVCEPDELGQIAVKRPNPVMFLEYWKRPEATRDKFIGHWMLTGDQGIKDDEGYFFFVGRDDDVITSSGYRIGPGEIEDCLIRHPAVALAAVVGKPDPIRNEIVKAFVQLKPGHAASETLASEIQNFVKTQLAAHEYPREVAFVESMPMTTTGKVIRRLLREQA